MQAHGLDEFVLQLIQVFEFATWHSNLYVSAEQQTALRSSISPLSFDIQSWICLVTADHYETDNVGYVNIYGCVTVFCLRN